MAPPFVVVEGVVDEVVIRSVLSSRDLEPAHVIITGGKSTLDARIARYNQAARLRPWLVGARLRP